MKCLILLFAFLAIFSRPALTAHLHKAIEIYDVGSSSKESLDKYRISQDYADILYKAEAAPDSDYSDSDKVLVQVLRPVKRPKKLRNPRSKVIGRLKSLISHLESVEDTDQGDGTVFVDKNDRNDRPKLILVDREKDFSLLVPKKRKLVHRVVPIQIPVGLRSRGGEVEKRHTKPPPSRHVYEKPYEY